MKRWQVWWRITWRAPLIVILLSSGAVTACLWMPRDARRMRQQHWWVVRTWHRCLLWVLGVQVRFNAKPHSDVHLLIANHVSWVDIPVISSVLDTCFVAKTEIRHWPVIGYLCRRVGSIFIPRGQPGAAETATQVIIERLQHQQNVLLFPEATTTDGSSVREFHARMFEAAVQTGVAVRPLAVRYPDCPEAPFIDDDALFPHLFRLIARATSTAELVQLDAIPSDNKARKQLAKQAHTAVLGVVNPSQQTVIEKLP